MPVLPALAAYLAAAPAAPNPPADAPGLPPARLATYRGGGTNWHLTVNELAAAASALNPAEMAQGFGRALSALSDGLGAEGLLGAAPRLLEAGDAASVEAAWPAALDALNNADHADIARFRVPDGPKASDPMHRSDGPAHALLHAAHEAAKACRLRRRPRGDGEVAYAAACALERCLVALADIGPELGPEELLAFVHRHLDPAARQAAPGGLWVVSRVHGAHATATYGRGEGALVEARFRVSATYSRWLDDAPSYHHALLKFRPARGTRAEDRLAALADLAARGVRAAAAPVDSPAAADLEAAGFIYGGGAWALPAPAALALRVSLPRPRLAPGAGLAGSTLGAYLGSGAPKPNAGRGRPAPFDLNRVAAAARAVCEGEGDDWCFDGGCGVFAVALNRFLGGSDGDRTFACSYSRRDVQRCGSRCYAHVALRWRGVLLDGNGVVTREDLLGYADRPGALTRTTTGVDAMDCTDVTNDPDFREAEVRRLEAALRAAYERAGGGAP